jgi:protein-tyrosine-phosphatase/DNA-binding HxlR family transcriptional regulator
MNSEQVGELERRAAVHAALGDPARLRIADTLLIGDASPSELASMLEMPSNLLAHHLKALERAGLVTRHRSEGDRRRTYLRLARDVLGQLGPAVQAAPERVVFVCTANSARSHLAAALWRRTSVIPTASAGTHPAAAIDPGALAAARRHHLPMPRLRPRHLDEVRGESDLIVTVCDLAHEELGTRSAVHWSVPDPALPGTTAAFEAAYDDLSVRVSELARLVAVPA